MIMFWHHPPRFLHRLWPEVVWHLPAAGEEVYLTFDDGPDPEFTPRLLDWLGENGAKATFFCVGRQVEEYPALFERIKSEGHAVGNHTYSHLSGHIRPSQIRYLKQKYTIVMWDVMTGDYAPSTPLTRISHRLRHYVKPGSVVVGHD